MTSVGVGEVEHIKDLGITYLRNLAKLKAENPRSFTIAYLIEKFRLN